MTVYYNKSLNGCPPSSSVDGVILPLTQINQILGLFKPTFYDRSKLASCTKTTVTIHAGLQVAINGRLYFTESDTILNLDTAISYSDRAGKNVYIYACQPSDTESFYPNLVLSLNSTVPSGYTADNSRKIGGFHCLCVGVGTNIGSSHPLYGYSAGDILAASMWDLRHLPTSDPEGMYYYENLGLWEDIYLPSWNGSKLVSEYGGVVADGGTSHPAGAGFHGENFVEYFAAVKKRLITRDEFVVMSQGTPECVNIKGSSDPNTTGGHIMTNGYRCISNYGAEDSCGVYWQWTSTLFEYWPGTTIDSTNRWLSGYSWSNVSVYHPECDSATHGDAHGVLRRALVGGFWDDSSHCGPRCVACSNFSSDRVGFISARGVAEPRTNLNV